MDKHIKDSSGCHGLSPWCVCVRAEVQLCVVASIGTKKENTQYQLF